MYIICCLARVLFTVLIDNFVHHFCCRFGMLQNKKTMNPTKRKAEDQDETHYINEQKESESNESENENANNLNYVRDECGISVDQQKSDNGGSSDRPGTSDKKSVDESKDLGNQTSEQRDKKLVKLEGSKIAGTLLYSGGTNYDLIGRKELPKNAKNATGANLWGPHRLASLKGIRVIAAFSGCSAVHSVIITDNGQAYSWGRNDKSQLGLGDTKRRDIPTLIETLKDTVIISASCGRSHTLLLSDKGQVYSCGDSKFGQCGTGSQNTTIAVPTKINFKGRSIAKVACGAEFSMIVDLRGGLYSMGCPEYGQLGHNSDGKYFVTSNKLAFRCELVPRRVIAFIEKSRDNHISLIDDVQIVQVACGINHTVAVDSKGHCFSWGFGGYGRLGHAEQKDELVPRVIKTFDGPNAGRGVKKAWCGGSFSMATNIHDVLYFWGQSKRCGEATMYPKPVPDLIGWQIRDVACSNCSIVCVADESVIAWGPSPTYGELGYGESKPKSSTTPQEVKPLDGLHIYSVAMGYGHTLFIARDETEEDQKKLEQLPEHAP